MRKQKSCSSWDLVGWWGPALSNSILILAQYSYFSFWLRVITFLFLFIEDRRNENLLEWEVYMRKNESLFGIICLVIREKWKFSYINAGMIFSRDCRLRRRCNAECTHHTQYSVRWNRTMTVRRWRYKPQPQPWTVVISLYHPWTVTQIIKGVLCIFSETKFLPRQLCLTVSAPKIIVFVFTVGLVLWLLS